MKRFFSAFVSVLLLIAASSSAGIYSGSLSTADGLTSGGSGWTVPPGFVVEWQVSQNQDDTWHYMYTFEDEGSGALSPAVSHFIISLSNNIQSSDLMNFTASSIDGSSVVPILGDQIEIDMESGYGLHKSNPSFPEDEYIYGVKINVPQGDLPVIEFDSTRMPMWGDFYAKGGSDSYVYNNDLGVQVVDPHDIAGAFDSAGNSLYKVAVPNSANDYNVPEPATLLLFGLGGLVFRKRKA